MSTLRVTEANLLDWEVADDLSRGFTFDVATPLMKTSMFLCRFTSAETCSPGVSKQHIKQGLRILPLLTQA